MILEPLLGPFNGWHDATANDRLEQVFLAREIQVTGALAHSCARGDIFEARCSKAALDE